MQCKLVAYRGVSHGPFGAQEIVSPNYSVQVLLPNGRTVEIGLIDKRKGFPFCRLKPIELFIPSKRELIARSVERVRDEHAERRLDEGEITFELSPAGDYHTDKSGTGPDAKSAGK